MSEIWEKKVKEMLYPDWENSMDIRHSGFQEEQTDVAEVKDVAEDETEGGKRSQIRGLP